MKLLLVTAMLFVSFVYASPNSTEPTSEKEKTEKKSKAETKENVSKTRNFHSIKKWKITIEYINGDTIIKTIVIKENSKLSALETAFMEAEKYSRTLKKVKGYSVSPVSSNSFVLLAGN